MRGPIDYLIVGFDGLKFDGSILRELGAAIDSGVIDLVALKVLAKDKDGVVTFLGLDGLGDQAAVEFYQKYSPSDDLVDQDDVDEVAELLEPDSAAGLLVVEHLWAKPLKKAIVDAGGYLIADGRIHPDAVVEIEGGN